MQASTSNTSHSNENDHTNMEVKKTSISSPTLSSLTSQLGPILPHLDLPLERSPSFSISGEVIAKASVVIEEEKEQNSNTIENDQIAQPQPSPPQIEPLADTKNTCKETQRKLSENVCEEIREEDDQDSIRALWHKFDRDHNGAIDYREFCSTIIDLLQNTTTNSINNPLHSTSMSLMELRFQRHLRKEIQRQFNNLEKAVENIFESIDKNHSGKITQIEFEESIQELGIMDFNYEIHGQKKRFANNSLIFFSTKNRFRYWIVWLIEWKWFDRFILACILINSIILALRDYEDPGLIPSNNSNPNKINQFVEKMENFFTKIFFIESFFKIIGMGFFFGKGSYMRNVWNVMDFFVVICGLATDLPGVPTVSALRTIRVLRPLRTLSNLHGMRTLVYSLFSAIPSLVNVLIVLGFIFTVFGILGVMFLGGALDSKCRTTEFPINGIWQLTSPIRTCGGTYHCQSNEFCGSIYDPPKGFFINMTYHLEEEKKHFQSANFDHIGLAIFTLFQCITLEGWTQIMYEYQDSYDWAFVAFYFVLFTLVGAFFLLQFIFAVIWERFSAANDNASGEWDLLMEEYRRTSTSTNININNTISTTTSSSSSTTMRKSYTTTMNWRKGSSIVSSLQKNLLFVEKNSFFIRFKKFCHQIVVHSFFSWFIVVCILFNTIFLAMDEYPMDFQRNFLLEKLQLFLTLIFCMEMFLKIIGLGMKKYCQDKYNLFDGILVLLSVFEIGMDFQDAIMIFFGNFEQNNQNISIKKQHDSLGLSSFRIFRLFRIMKLARSWKSLRDLISTIANSIMDVANFGLLLLLLMYVFALIGMQFFATKFRFDSENEPVEWQPFLYENNHSFWDSSRPYTIRRSNFDDTLFAFTTIFQLLSEENWTSIMADGIKTCGWAAAFFFVCVMIIGNIILLNLFLAILLGNFGNNDNDNTSPFDDEEEQDQKDQENQRGNNNNNNSNLSKEEMVQTKENIIKGKQKLQEFLQQKKKSISLGGGNLGRNSIRKASMGGSESIGRGSIGRNSSRGSGSIGRLEKTPVLSSSSPSSVSPLSSKVPRSSTNAVDFFPFSLQTQGTNKLNAVAPMPSSSSSSSSIPSSDKIPVNITKGNELVVVSSKPRFQDIQRLQAKTKVKQNAVVHPEVSTATSDRTTPICSSEWIQRDLTNDRKKEKSIQEETLPAAAGGDGSGSLPPERRSSRLSSKLKHQRSFTSNSIHPTGGVLFPDKSNHIHFKSSKKSCKNLLEDDRSLFLFSEKHILRRIATKIVHDSKFEAIVLLLIASSSIQLSIDNPLNDPESSLSALLSAMDNVFTGIFLIEMCLKVLDKGFLLNGKQSYLRDPWNILDFCILISSITTFSSSNKTLRSLRSLRTLRALRPLRMISRVPGMRRVVNALISSIPSILNVFLVCSLVYLIFGIVATNLFKGKFFLCDMSAFDSSKMYSLQKEFGFSSKNFKKLFSQKDCETNGGKWIKRKRNYDNVFKSAMTLFEISTTEGWVDLMYQGVDATEIGYHPVENYNRGYVFFFIIFIIIGSFFTLNLFVGAVIDNFNRMRDTLGTQFNETQREWHKIQDLIKSIKLIPIVQSSRSRSTFRRLCIDLTQHQSFEKIIAICVLLNTLMLAIHSAHESQGVTTFLNIGNIIFWGIFFLEALMKIFALGTRYFHDNWNCFDFAVVIGSTISLFLQITTDGKVTPVANALRAFRMGLALRLMKKTKSMQDIVNTMLDNMPALINVSTLMFLMIFVYAVIGMQLYAEVMLGDALNEHANFRDIFTAILTLFRFTTGESWNDVMYDLMVQPNPNDPLNSCQENVSYQELEAMRMERNLTQFTIGCSPGIAITYIYFVSYMLLTTYVMINLFVAVILEGFEETNEKNASPINEEDLQLLAELWQKYDPLATGWISDHHFMKLLKELPPPLGIVQSATRREIESFATKLDLQVVDGKISFQAFMLASSQMVMMKVAADRGTELILPTKINSFLTRSQQAFRRVAKRAITLHIGSTFTLLVIISARRIQALVRSHLVRRKFLRLKKELEAQLGRSVKLPLSSNSFVGIHPEEREQALHGTHSNNYNNNSYNTMTVNSSMTEITDHIIEEERIEESAAC